MHVSGSCWLASISDVLCAVMSVLCLPGLTLLNCPAVLVMCDVLNPDSSPHATNTRAKLVELLTPDVVAEKPMYGFEQVWTYSLAPSPCHQ